MKNISHGLFMGIDQGTQSSRAIVFDHNGQVIAKAQTAISIKNISAVEVEQDGVEVMHSITSCLSKIFSQINPGSIKAAGLATQRSSVIAWNNDTGEPLSPILSWRDRRAADFVNALRPHEKLIQNKTGLRLTAYYGASKIRWLLRNNHAVKNALDQQKLNIGPLASFLVFSLCENNPYLLDHANALRTQLLNLRTLDWDDELFKLFEIPSRLLPKPAPTNFYYEDLLNTAIPLMSVNGDQTAAMYSLGQMEKGKILVNLGTGGFVLCPVDTNTSIPDGMLGGLSMSIDKTHIKIIEGTVNGCGSALNWYREIIGEKNQFNIDACIRSFKGEIIFLNGINGLGSPYWKEMQPAFLTASVHNNTITNPEPSQAISAIVESILFLIQININQIKKVIDIKSIRLTGGLANNKTVCQLLANLSGIKVTRPDITEATARGAAWLASGFKNPWPAGPKTQHYIPESDETLQSRFHHFCNNLNQKTNSSRE